MSKKKEPKPIIKACWKCGEFVAVVFNRNSGLCPYCRTKLYDKTAQQSRKKMEFHFRRIERKK